MCSLELFKYVVVRRKMQLLENSSEPQFRMQCNKLLPLTPQWDHHKRLWSWQIPCARATSLVSSQFLSTPSNTCFLVSLTLPLRHGLLSVTLFHPVFWVELESFLSSSVPLNFIVRNSLLGTGGFTCDMNLLPMFLSSSLCVILRLGWGERDGKDKHVRKRQESPGWLHPDVESQHWSQSNSPSVTAGSRTVVSPLYQSEPVKVSMITICYYFNCYSSTWEYNAKQFPREPHTLFTTLAVYKQMVSNRHIPNLLT